MIQLLAQATSDSGDPLRTFSGRPAYLVAALLFFWAVALFHTAESLRSRNHDAGRIIEVLALIATFLGSAFVVIWLFGL